MEQGSRKKPGAHEEKRVSLGELIHERVRGAVEAAVEEELAAALGAAVYERTDARRAAGGAHVGHVLARGVFLAIGHTNRF